MPLSVPGKEENPALTAGAWEMHYWGITAEQ